MILVQRYFAKDKVNNYIILEDSDMHHIKNVMRMNDEDRIECVYEKQVYVCRVGDVLDNKVEIIEIVVEDNELSCEVAVAIALVREQKMDLILQKLTELGVSKIIPLKMERSIVKLDDKKFKKKRERWLSICKEAAEQSHRNIIPEITELKTLKNLENIDYESKFVCSVSNKENLVNKYLQNNNKCDRMLFVIGPEGGISAKEEEYLNSIGFVSVSLGSRVLRVETAAIYVASVVSFCSMR